MRTSRLARALAVALAAPALVAATATPASAAAYSTDCAPDIYCFGVLTESPGLGTGRDIHVVCGAAGPVAAAATVLSCWIVGSHGDIHSVPTRTSQGPVVVATHTFAAWSLPSPAYQVCVAAGYYSSWGTYHEPSGFTCSAA